MVTEQARRLDELQLARDELNTDKDRLKKQVETQAIELQVCQSWASSTSASPSAIVARSLPVSVRSLREYPHTGTRMHARLPANRAQDTCTCEYFYIHAHACAHTL